MSGVWVWIEHRDGQILAISKESLMAARQVADDLGQPLTALVFGQGVAGIATSAFDLGADAVLGADDALLGTFRATAAAPYWFIWFKNGNPPSCWPGIPPPDAICAPG